MILSKLLIFLKLIYMVFKMFQSCNIIAPYITYLQYQFPVILYYII